VRANYDQWLAEQDNRGKAFTPEAAALAGHDARSHRDQPRDRADDFDLTPFAHEGVRQETARAI
jgi:hypothetical protein